MTNSYHKDHARKKVNLEDKARIGEWKKMQFETFSESEQRRC